MKPISYKTLVAGIVLGYSLPYLIAATSPAERELERMRAELERGNRHLDQISRSLDRIDDAFSSSRIRVQIDD